jgi:hypothetical protein
MDAAAERRADRRRQRRRGADPGEHARRSLAAVDVAHDGAAEHRSGAGADGLQETAGDHRLDRRRCDAGETADDVDGKTGDQHGTSPEAVGERAVDELRQGEADEEQAERQLDHGGAGMKIGDERRHRRGVDRHRERADGDERRQQHRAGKRIGTQAAASRRLSHNAGGARDCG